MGNEVSSFSKKLVRGTISDAEAVTFVRGIAEKYDPMQCGNSPFKQGTPLMYACTHRMLSLVEQFLNQKVFPIDLNFQGLQGQTCLHWAVGGSEDPEKRLELVKMLTAWKSTVAKPLKGRRRKSSLLKFSGRTTSSSSSSSKATKQGVKPNYLPLRWEGRYDQKRKRMYFVNHENETTTWEDPRPLPKGWVQVDSQYGRTFSNQETGMSVSYDPRGPPVTHPDSVDEIKNLSQNLHLDVLDKQGNSALHVAARNGLADVVEFLATAGANMTLVNAAGRTAAEEADEAGHEGVASDMEARLVLGQADGKHGGGNTADALDLSLIELELLQDENTPMLAIPETTDGKVSNSVYHSPSKSKADAFSHQALRLTELRAVKDRLLIEVSEFLGIDLFSAEALMRANHWNKQTVAEAWLTNPRELCAKAHIRLPVQHGGEFGASGMETNAACEVCMEDDVELEAVPCGHAFCADCWKGYLETKIEDGEVHSITCPAFDCDVLCPVVLIERYISNEAAQRYLEFDIRTFVDLNDSIKWCPAPGCGRAIIRKDPGEIADTALYRLTADCGSGKGHFFCFECSEEPHEPCSCDTWKAWKEDSAEARALIKNKGKENTGDLATAYWLEQNTRPCPKCKTRIQKADGCNHVSCTLQSCKHEFCWICRAPWSTHGTETGGYFSCNRWKGEGPTSSAEESKVSRKKLEQSGRFVHYFERFLAHEQSRELESAFLKNQEKREHQLRLSISALNAKPVDTKFFHVALTELLQNRLLLRNTYVYRYYIDGSDKGKRKRNGGLVVVNSMREQQTQILDMLHGDLENKTEVLSGKVARRRLKSSREEILRAAIDAKRSRESFLVAMRSDFRHLTRLSEGEERKLRERAQKEAKEEEAKSKRAEAEDGGNATRGLRDLLRRLPEGSTRTHLADMLRNLTFMQRGGQQPTGGMPLPPTPREPSLLPWECQMCSLRNSSSNESCEVCQNPRPELQQQPQEQQQLPHVSQQQLVPPIHQNASRWACSVCTLLNEPSATSCEVCGNIPS